MLRLNTSRILSFIVISIFLSNFSIASETRVATMGGNHLFIKDNSNIMMFPGILLANTDLAIAEMRTKNSNAVYTLGLHMDYGNMASALYLNMPIYSPMLSTGLGLFGGLNTTLNNGYVFMMGMDLNGMDVGFGLTTAGSSFETGSGVNKTEESMYYIGVLGGVSNKMMDLGVLIELPSITQEIGSGKAEYSGFGLQANGRYFLMKRKGMTIFPVGHVTFGSSSFEVKDGGKTDFTNIAFIAGIGVEKPINESNVLIVGVEAFNYNSVTADIEDFGETTTNLTTMPGFYVGIESQISSWLIGRVGARHLNQMRTVEFKPDGGGDKTETKRDGTAFKISLGLGMEFSNFLIDFSMNEGLLFDGPYVFSRSDNFTQFASTVSITYNFGGNDE